MAQHFPSTLSLLLMLTRVCLGEIGYSIAAVNYDGFALVDRLHRHAGTPGGVDPEFGCAARMLAFNVSVSLHKNSKANFSIQSVWDALQLTTLCKEKPPSFESSTRRAANLPLSASMPSDLPTFFVDSIHGSDHYPGTLPYPFKTIGRALLATREIGPEVRRLVYLRAGVYYLNDTLRLGPEDSYLTISSFLEENVVVSGGKLLNVSWKAYKVSTKEDMITTANMNNVENQVGPGRSTSTIHYIGKKDKAGDCSNGCDFKKGCQSWTWFDKTVHEYANMCYYRSDHIWLPQSENGATSGFWQHAPNIYVTDLQGVDDVPGLQVGTDEGNLTRATRARWPNVDSIETALFPDGWIPGGAEWLKPRNMGKPEYITISDPTYNLNPLFAHYQLGRNGPCSIFSPPESYWCAEKAQGNKPHTFQTPSGLTFEDGVIPDSPYDEKKLEANGAILHVWRPDHWATWMFAINKYDSKGRTFNWEYGGFQGARGNNTGAEWWIDNVFEELDFPNEFFYDKQAQKLYYFHNDTGPPPDEMEFVVTHLQTLVDIRGTMSSMAKNITLQGLKFTSAAYTYMEPHGVPSGGDWALQRMGAVFVEGAEGVAVQGCVFERLDGNALFLSGYTRNVLIEDNEFVWIGSSAMAAWGYTDMIDGTGGEQPRMTTVRRNFIHEIGHYEKQASCWFQAKSAQTTLTGNICFNGPGAGMTFNDGFGGGNVMQGNVLFNLCRESSDYGPINSWDRQPFITDVNDHSGSVFPAFNELHHNLIIGNYGSSLCINNDDGSAFYHLHDNYLVYGGHKSNFGGHDKISEKNFNIYPLVSKEVCFFMSTATTGFNNSDQYINCTCVLRGDKGELMYDVQPKCDVTKPDKLFFVVRNNTIYSPETNANVHVCGKTYAFQDWIKVGLDNGTIIKKSPKVDEIIGWGRKLFGV